MPADCEVLFRGEFCGVIAVGRCRRCGNAFCASHQGNTADVTLPPLVTDYDRHTPAAPTPNATPGLCSDCLIDTRRWAGNDPAVQARQVVENQARLDIQAVLDELAANGYAGMLERRRQTDRPAKKQMFRKLDYEWEDLPRVWRVEDLRWPGGTSTSPSGILESFKLIRLPELEVPDPDPYARWNTMNLTSADPVRNQVELHAILESLLRLAAKSGVAGPALPAGLMGATWLGDVAGPHHRGPSVAEQKAANARKRSQR